MDPATSHKLNIAILYDRRERIPSGKHTNYNNDHKYPALDHMEYATTYFN